MPRTDPFLHSFDPQFNGDLVHNLSVDALIQDCLRFDSCVVADRGAVVAYSGKYTGRTPKDKYLVREPAFEHRIWWESNNDLAPADYAQLRSAFKSYSVGKRLYGVDAYAGADPAYRIRVRLVVERAYHALFMKQLLLRPSIGDLASFEPEWTIVDFGKMPAPTDIAGIQGSAAIAIDFAEREVLIAGTEYAGEIKKAVFTVMNLLLPLKGVLSMHCSANIGIDGNSALFFGLSGTGKTTLSTDPDRRLIGDDEHGWSDDGIFNIEGGCYAKCINLDREREPQIWNAIRPGAILENVVLVPRGTPNFEDSRITENTRAAYPIEYIPNSVKDGKGRHPKDIFFLTCDALGVLPPIARLSPQQAMFHFLNGYTAKVAGTERDVTEPTLTFSACFGQPFLPLPPKRYSDLLGSKIKEHSANVWLVNTGWTGGPYGIGKRMKLEHTRAMLRAVFRGEIGAKGYCSDPVFGLDIPNACPGVPTKLLHPRATWADADAYDTKAIELRDRFQANYAKFV